MDFLLIKRLLTKKKSSSRWQRALYASAADAHAAAAPECLNEITGRRCAMITPCQPAGAPGAGYGLFQPPNSLHYFPRPLDIQVIPSSSAGCIQSDLLYLLYEILNCSYHRSHIQSQVNHIHAFYFLLHSSYFVKSNNVGTSIMCACTNAPAVVKIVKRTMANVSQPMIF